MHLDTNHITSTVKDCWGVTLDQRLNNLQERRRHLTVEEYCSQYKETIDKFNASIKKQELSWKKMDDAYDADMEALSREADLINDSLKL
tara:strand:- start:216 stop:482 length:267 start_codon:yes stop_codon:yes gene_type:complete